MTFTDDEKPGDRIPVFSDSDLKRLKEALNAIDHPSVYRLVPALIARLEAAEAFIAQLQKDEIDDSDLDEDQRLFDAWRKAAGK